MFLEEKGAAELLVRASVTVLKWILSSDDMKRRWDLLKPSMSSQGKSTRKRLFRKV